MKPLFCLLLATTSLWALQPIEVAVQEQNAASSAFTPQEKQYLLNAALATYLEHAADSPSGMLLSNIGSVYFSLGELGTAIAYYHQAHALLPRNALIQQNLHTAIEQAGVAHLQQPKPITNLLGLQWCSPAERSALVVGAIAVTLVFFSLNLWFPSVSFLIAWRTAAICTALLLSSLIWYTLFVPQQAVVLHAAPLRPSPEAASTELGLPTVRAGEVVQVLAPGPHNDVLQVQTALETVGYIPRNDLCFPFSPPAK